MARLAQELLDHEEMQAVSIDATLRCCLPIMGQVHPRAQKKMKDQAVFAGEKAMTRVSKSHSDACDNLSFSFAANSTSAVKC